MFILVTPILKCLKVLTRVSCEHTDVLEPETDDDFPEPLDLSPRDESALSPLFQRSVSEDSAGSSASTTRNTKSRLVTHTHCTMVLKMYACVHVRVGQIATLKRQKESSLTQFADGQKL